MAIAKRNHEREKKKVSRKREKKLLIPKDNCKKSSRPRSAEGEGLPAGELSVKKAAKKREKKFQKKDHNDERGCAHQLDRRVYSLNQRKAHTGQEKRENLPAPRGAKDSNGQKEAGRNLFSFAERGFTKEGHGPGGNDHRPKSTIV